MCYQELMSFSNLVAVFHSCLASHPLLICLGLKLLIRLCIFRRHGGLNPIVSEAIPMDLCGFLFGVAPAPFCVVSLFSLLAKRKSGGRFACRRCCRVSFCCVGFSMVCLVCEAKGFHTFCTLFSRFSHCQDRALERDRPQQRKN